jgi:hypothetical protein
MNNTSRISSGSEGFWIEHKPILRSPYFIIATFVGLASLAVDAWTIFQYHVLLAQRSLLLYPILIFFQIINVWIRAIRYQTRIMAIPENEPFAVKNVQALAVGGLVEIIVWAVLLIFILLFYVLLLCQVAF